MLLAGEGEGARTLFIANSDDASCVFPASRERVVGFADTLYCTAEEDRCAYAEGSFVVAIVWRYDDENQKKEFQKGMTRGTNENQRQTNKNVFERW